MVEVFITMIYTIFVLVTGIKVGIAFEKSQNADTPKKDSDETRI